MSHNPEDNDIRVLVRIFLDKVGKNGLEILGWRSVEAEKRGCMAW